MSENPDNNNLTDLQKLAIRKYIFQLGKQALIYLGIIIATLTGVTWYQLLETLPKRVRAEASIISNNVTTLSDSIKITKVKYDQMVNQIDSLKTRLSEITGESSLNIEELVEYSRKIHQLKQEYPNFDDMFKTLGQFEVQTIGDPLSHTGIKCNQSYTFKSNGGQLLFFASGSARSDKKNQNLDIGIELNGNRIGNMHLHANEPNIHMALGSDFITVKDIPASENNIVELRPSDNSLVDDNDQFKMLVMELPVK